MKTTLQTLLIVLCLSSLTSGAELIMDAAELDLQGNPLPHPCVLPIYDNSGSAVDATGVSFTVAYSGDCIGGGGLNDSENPWVSTYPTIVGGFIRDNRRWHVGTQTALGNVWSPVYTYFRLEGDPEYQPFVDGLYPGLTESDWHDIFNKVQLPAGTVPAGFVWYHPRKLLGENVRLFHSPAEGTFTDDAGAHAVFDADRMPQLAPEPGTVALLALGAGTLIRRRRS
jgi:hypothetical protein